MTFPKNSLAAKRDHALRRRNSCEFYSSAIFYQSIISWEPTCLITPFFVAAFPR